MEDFLTFGYFGEDTAYSISSQVINAFFDELKLPAVYIPFGIEDNKFITALSVLRTKFNGFNLSQEYEIEISDHLEKLDKTARNTGAVSTVKIDNGKVVGYNTDIYGFEHSLSGFVDELNNKKVLVIGAEGEAYAVCEVLLRYGADVTALTDDNVKAHMLKSKMRLTFDEEKIRTQAGLNDADEFYMIINTTKNSEGIPLNVYKKINCAYDLGFGITPFLKNASDAGAKVKDGFDMIFFKSIETLKVWFDQIEIPEEMIIKVYNNIRANNITA